MAQSNISATMRLVSFTNLLLTPASPPILFPSLGVSLNWHISCHSFPGQVKLCTLHHFLLITKWHIILFQAFEYFLYLECLTPSSLSGELPSMGQDLLLLLPVPRKSHSFLWTPMVPYTFLHNIPFCTVTESFLLCLTFIAYAVSFSFPRYFMRVQANA